MVVFLIIAVIAGTLLGLRFKLFVLVPATMLATVVIIVSSHEPRVIALTMVGTVVSLQIGYIAGCVLRVVAGEHLPGRKTARYSTSGSEPAH